MIKNILLRLTKKPWPQIFAIAALIFVFIYFIWPLMARGARAADNFIKAMEQYEEGDPNFQKVMTGSDSVLLIYKDEVRRLRQDLKEIDDNINQLRKQNDEIKKLREDNSFRIDSLNALEQWDEISKHF